MERLFIAEKRFAMPLKKPPSIEADEFKSAKRDEVTRGRDFRESDAPTLEVLMEWYSVTQGRVFPAHAGMIPSEARAAARRVHVPRTRGDDPAFTRKRV